MAEAKTAEYEILEIPIELWSDDKQDKFVAERVKIHAAATLENLPECTDEERWLAKGSFAVKRGKQKKALKLMNSFYEAEQWIKKIGEAKESIAVIDAKFKLDNDTG